MVVAQHPADPTDLEAVRRFLAEADPESRLVPLGIERLSIGADAHREVADAVAQVLDGSPASSRPNVVMLVDAALILRRELDYKALVEEELRTRYSVTRHVLDDGHPTLHADEGVLDEATAAVQGADVVVTVGSGTITDIGKVAADRNDGLPLVVVQTAASVDGFTDNVSVILRNGVKRTIPSKWPDAVVTDTETVREAPQAMNTAGFGEVLSLFTAPADWYLASLVGLDPSFHTGPTDLLLSVAEGLTEWSAGVAGGEPEATERLVQALAIRGVATGVAGTTACLSGVEHVISHMLDMHHGHHDLPLGLHGAQVGVASLVAAAVWQLLLEEGSAAFSQARIPDAEAMQFRVQEAFGALDAEGAVAQECWADYSSKLDRIGERWERFQALFDDWGQHRADLRALVTPAAELRDALAASGAPAEFEQLDPSISPSLARWAVANCHLMRNRFTVVDLLEILGLWTDAAVDRVLQVALSDPSRPSEA
jgi:glycerol-1-phosphate dehydrogenase [NAD(P)+]